MTIDFLQTFFNDFTESFENLELNCVVKILEQRLQGHSNVCSVFLRFLLVFLISNTYFSNMKCLLGS